MLMINLVYLIAICSANVFVLIVLRHIVQTPGDPTEWLYFTNLRGPFLWCNIVAILSMGAANGFYVYGSRFRKVTKPQDVGGAHKLWLVLWVCPTLVCSVIAFNGVVMEVFRK